MDPWLQRKQSDGQPRRSIAANVSAYLFFAFGFAWAAWILAIKGGAGEELLNIGTAGPALAAMALSRTPRSRANPERIKRTLTFLLVLALGWIILSLRYDLTDAPGLHLRPILLLPAVFPAWILAGIFAANDGERALLQRLLHRPNKWTLFALLFFPVLLGLPSVLAAALGLPLIQPASHGSLAANVAAGTVFFAFNLLFVAMLEEPGWRGFLLDRLQLRLSPLLASFAVWLPWAVWHAPLDYYRPVRFSLTEYILLRVVFLIPMTIILTWLYNRSHRSIQSTAVFHCVMNTFPFVVPYYQFSFLLIFVFAGYAVVAGKMWRRSYDASSLLANH
jgi:membrane protease YdiL (CAAX protease family)